MPAKVSEEVDIKSPPLLVQELQGTRYYNFQPYTDPESHNGQCHRQRDRRTDGQQYHDNRPI